MADINIIKTPKNKNKVYSTNEVSKIKDQLFLARFLCVMFFICMVYVLYSNTKDMNDMKETIQLLRSQRSNLETELDLSDMHYDILKMQLDDVQASLEDATATINSLEAELEEKKTQLESAEGYINNSITAPITKQYNRYTDLGVTEVMSTDRMNRIIDYWLDRNGGSDSPFKDHGEYFIKASQESGLDPIFIFAIASHESDFGRSRIARNKKNFMGIGAVDVTPYSSALVLGDSTESGLVQNSKWVADKYYNQGQTTLHSMIYGKKQYSTSTEKWINDIANIMAKSKEVK